VEAHRVVDVADSYAGSHALSGLKVIASSERDTARILAGIARGGSLSEIADELHLTRSSTIRLVQRLADREGLRRTLATYVDYGYRSGILVGLSPQPKPLVELSDGEADALPLVADGLTDLEIARRLGVAQDTINSRMKRIRYKFNSRTRAQAVAVGYQHEYLWVAKRGRIYPPVIPVIPSLDDVS
jgi:DNA-binding CsgD family transcriptional regulator